METFTRSIRSRYSFRFCSNSVCTSIISRRRRVEAETLSTAMVGATGGVGASAAWDQDIHCDSWGTTGTYNMPYARREQVKVRMPRGGTIALRVHNPNFNCGQAYLPGWAFFLAQQHELDFCPMWQVSIVQGKSSTYLHGPFEHKERN